MCAHSSCVDKIMSCFLRLSTTRALPRTAPASLRLACNFSVSLRYLSSRTSATTSASAKKTHGRKKKPLAAAAAAVVTSPGEPSSSSLTPSSATPRKRHSASAVPDYGKAVQQHEERALMEQDVRLAMRMLMTAHLSRSSHTRRQGDAQLEKEREAYAEKHEARERRLWRKDENSRYLLGEDSRSLGDGIVPLVPSPTQNPYLETSLARGGLRSGGGASGSAAGGSAAWRTLNPVGLAASQAAAATNADAVTADDYAAFLLSATTAATAEGGGVAAPTAAPGVSVGGGSAELDDWRSATLATLCAPDLSVYDTDHDFRVCSEDVVRQSQEAAAVGQQGRRAQTATTQSAFSSSSPFPLGEGAAGEGTEELDADLPATAAAQLKQQFADEEDPDYAVSLYTADSDEDAGPLQL